MHVLHVVGARPNIIKAAPVMRALVRRGGIRQTLVHTGQHYDLNMSDVFFQQLGIPKPDCNLAVGSDSHSRQVAKIMSCFEPVVLKLKPDLVLVYGDVNSTLAAALVCAKLPIPIGHVEAGLRSFDRTMPEEINRLLTDQISDLLFTPSSHANENLVREGVARNKICFVGNVMIDTLMRLLPVAEESVIRTELGLLSGGYGLITLHRPSNVDDLGVFASIMEAFDEIGDGLPLIFAIHPRTRQRLRMSDAQCSISNLRIIDPLGYLDFLALQRHAMLVITDSGGIQEETTFLGVPCLTVRKSTVRPVTVTLGTNILVGQDVVQLRAEVDRILAGNAKKGEVPPLWDGHSAERIADAVVDWEGRRDRSSPAEPATGDCSS